MTEEIGYIAVDSATVLIVDPSYMYDSNEEDAYQASLHDYWDEDGNIVHQTHGRFTSDLGAAVRVCTNDGIYPVFAEYGEDGSVAAVRIVFDRSEPVAEPTPDFDELYSAICDVVERTYNGMPLEHLTDEEWRSGQHPDNDPLFHSSTESRAAAFRIFELLGIEVAA